MARWNEKEPGTKIGSQWFSGQGGDCDTFNPSTGEKLCSIAQIDRDLYEKLLIETHQEFLRWRSVPAPKRGEVVRQLGNALREHKQFLGELISLEMGKILEEGLGEVQEAIDIADYAVGLSRQLYGVTTKSERSDHRMYEQWHPLGVNAFITAFNFPIAVWAWNAMLSAVCGNTMIWKPSSKTPLCAVMTHKIIQPVLDQAGFPNLMNLAIGRGADLGEWINSDTRIPLISATGSCRMGKRIGSVVAERFGKTILELGGNNAIIVAPSANLELALKAVLFGSVGTAGQRCTSTRRLFLHKSHTAVFLEKLIKAYQSVPIGLPSQKGILMGPLIDQGAVNDMLKALEEARNEGAEILYGGEKLTSGSLARGNFVTPCIVKSPKPLLISREETFAPILYVNEYLDLKEAIHLQNNVEQGLSSSLFTGSMQESELFLSERGSDCGIANINLGTSGAEIGLAFGGEKATGGGREAGSDCWKYYMRRQTNTLNWGKEMPLAQGVQFDI